jgi:hypothetical protein
MNTMLTRAFALSLLSGVAISQVPATNDKSDSFYNTGMGTGALVHITPGIKSKELVGYGNSASGYEALYSTAIGSQNTATGYWALYANTSGVQNTASGWSALQDNTTGGGNTAIGIVALNSNTSGYLNTACGSGSLQYNTTGYLNTAVGNGSLRGYDEGGVGDATGIMNTAIGAGALQSYSTGSDNSAVGNDALSSVTTGSNNIALGASAGYSLTTGTNNIEIGNEGAASESGKIRIGTPGTQTATYIAGIENAKVTGSAVYITSQGQLGVLASSERYKTEIAAIGSESRRLLDLRPVKFKLRNDPTRTPQYGLIAEDVARVYPELVVRDEHGVIQGVRYEELAPMLVNEVQRQQAELTGRATEFLEMKRQLEDLRAEVLELQARENRVAMR